jgi:hypothetical protein
MIGIHEAIERLSGVVFRCDLITASDAIIVRYADSSSFDLAPNFHRAAIRASAVVQ